MSGDDDEVYDLADRGDDRPGLEDVDLEEDSSAGVEGAVLDPDADDEDEEDDDEDDLDDDEIDDLDPDGEDAVAPAAAESESDAEPEPEPELATEIAPEPAPASVQDEVDEILAEAGIDDAAGDAPDAESTR